VWGVEDGTRGVGVGVRKLGEGEGARRRGGVGMGG